MNVSMYSLLVKQFTPKYVSCRGFNSYGELGLGDLDLRIQPTRMTAMARGRLISVSCGDRHSVIVSNHIPLKVREDRSIKPYLAALEVIIILAMRMENYKK